MLTEQYAETICHAIQEITQHQKENIRKAAEMAADTMEQGGLIYIFGCGHSGILSCEGFYRAGGLACVAPVFHEPLMLHESASESSRLEKQTGYADQLKGKIPYEPRDLLICVSTSDKNAVPVEYAAYVSGMGVRTVAICSGAYGAAQIHNACGRHLHQVCDMTIDNLAPFGDACLQPRGVESAMAPLSTITGAFILNSLLAEAAELAASRGVQVPVYASGNIPGGAEKNRSLIEEYARRIKCL